VRVLFQKIQSPVQMQHQDGKITSQRELYNIVLFITSLNSK